MLKVLKNVKIVQGARAFILGDTFLLQIQLTCCLFQWRIGSCQTAQPRYSRFNI